MELILVINPGSTSTKIAVYEEDAPLFVEKIEHDPALIAQFKTIPDQFAMRRELILEVLKAKGVKLENLTAIVSRGGPLLSALSGATYIDDLVVDDLVNRPHSQHASILGSMIAHDLAQPLDIPAYIYDPVTVDELEPIARVTGFPEIQRIGIGHNLNMRAVAKKYAAMQGVAYEKLNLIVAHLGSGITISLHHGGRMVDMVTDDEGSFSPERSGGAPVTRLGKFVIDRQFSYKEFMHLVKRGCGFQAYFGVMDAREIEARIAGGDQKAALVYEAFAYNVAKNIGQLAPVVNGQIDAIILTGGMAYSEKMVNWISERVRFIAPVVLFPGEDEMSALALGALRVQRGEEQAQVFVRREPVALF